MKPFLVPNAEMLRTDGPNALTSAAYAEDFNEVKELGSLTSTSRTADQTAAAIFWQDSGTDLERASSARSPTSQDLDIAESARLFAMANLAGADGSIGCWNDKYYWSFWRPITAIREAGERRQPGDRGRPDLDAAVQPDDSRLRAPLVTPGFPDHPSGHTCISGAIVRDAAGLLRHRQDRVHGGQPSALPRPARRGASSRFSEALKEIIDARVWGGIHFRTADVQGTVLGKKVAHYLGKHYFQPVN